MGDTCQLKYTGSTPGADGNTYNLFNSATMGLPVRFGGLGYKRLVLDIKNDQAGTLKWYKSQSRVTSTNTTVVWTQIGEAAIAAAAATDTNVRDLLIEEYADFKVDWVNGGVAQTTWIIDIALTDERNPA